MSHATSEAYDEGFDLAEREMMCYVPDDANDRRHCNYLVSRGGLVAPMSGMFARPEYWEKLSVGERHLHVARALSKKHPSWVFSHHTAALAYGLHVGYRDIGAVHRSLARGASSRTRGIVNHIVGERSSDIVSGLRVTLPEQTVFDCLCSTDFRQGLAIADSSCRFLGMNPERLATVVESYASPHSRGIKTARLAAEYADSRSESGGESIARAMMIMLGYMIPELQVEIPDPVYESAHYRADFLWELSNGRKIVGELDGREKYINEEMTAGRDLFDIINDERLRESRIREQGYAIMRMSFHEAVRVPTFVRILEYAGIPTVREPWPRTQIEKNTTW